MIDGAADNGKPIFVSPITAWKIGMLMVRGRLKSALPPQRWFHRLLDVPGVRLADMSPEILIASSFLPGNLRRDPADRILVATAREHDYVLLTRDAALLDYALEGYVQARAC